MTTDTTALVTIFESKEIFRKTRYEELGVIATEKTVTCLTEEINLGKEYLRCIVGALGRENHYILYLWNEIGDLVEINITDENQGTLLEIISTIEDSDYIPTHIIVAKDRTYDGYEEEWTHKQIPSERKQTIIVYTLTEGQRQEIKDLFQPQKIPFKEQIVPDYRKREEGIIVGEGGRWWLVITDFISWEQNGHKHNKTKLLRSMSKRLPGGSLISVLVDITWENNTKEFIIKRKNVRPFIFEGDVVYVYVS